MYWIPYRAEDLSVTAKWFSEQQNFKLFNISKMKAFLKNLFFDKNNVQNLKSQRINKNLLKNYVQDGRISLKEYLYLSR
jgi:hypothetical protein